MELNKYKKKFKELFEKFSKENFELSAYDCDNLLKFLDSSADKNTTKILETPFFCDLVLYALKTVEDVTNSAKIFLLGVIRILIRNELQFCKFLQMQGHDLLPLKLSKTKTFGATPALKAAYFKMFSEILAHSSGVNWTLQHKIYTVVLKPHTHSRPWPCPEICYEYLSRLVWKLDEDDEDVALTEVLAYIVAPIKNNKYVTIKELTDDMDAAFFEELVSSLNAFLVILSDTDRMVRKNKVIPLLNKKLLLDFPFNVMLEVTRQPELVYLLNNIIFRLAFGNMMSHALANEASVNEIPHEMTAVYYNMVMMTKSHKRMVVIMLKFSASCLKFWWKIDERIVPTVFERYGRKYDLKDQFLFMLLLPVLAFGNKKTFQQAELNGYHYKLTQLISEHVIKAAYYSRDLNALNRSQVRSCAFHSFKELFGLMNYLNDKQAGYIYQALFYFLGYFVNCDDEDETLTVEESPITCPEDIKAISHVLELIKSLLTGHNINWYDNVEIISLQNCLMNLLMQKTLPTKQLLQALDLIDLSIQKLLSPDLALLVESRRGSTLNEIVAMMKTFLQHTEWEVRDSALHLLLSCTDLAHIKYMPLQKLLHDNGILVLAAQAAVFDEEMYVQATALRCLAAATKIESIWRHVTTSHSDLFTQIIHILRNHPEGIVRAGAANILTEYYRNQNASPDFTNCLFNIMTSAALDDLHWEVQLVALDFWKATVKYQTSNHGIIDGKFPTVTFCKVRRKIIALNDQMIQEQLNGILNALANNGCLKVLINCLSEDSNVRILEKAHDIAIELTTILDIYKFKCVPKDKIVKTIEPKKEDDISMETLTLEATLPEILREQIIEIITNTNQADVILEMYENFVEIKTEVEDTTIIVDKWMNPNKFLNIFRSTNYENMIESKMNWNSGPKNLDALLNELLALETNEKEISEECS